MCVGRDFKRAGLVTSIALLAYYISDNIIRKMSLKCYHLFILF